MSVFQLRRFFVLYAPLIVFGLVLMLLAIFGEVWNPHLWVAGMIPALVGLCVTAADFSR